MAILGIIAEFNPLHNGHLFLLNKALNTSSFSGTVCVMSGNFLQRGEPALCNKWVRTQMALEAGIDLVIELPFCYSVRSAHYFARGALQLLERTGVVTHLAFGSESGSLAQLQSIATIISNEDPSFQNILREHLNRGLSFPSARSIALQQYTKEKSLNVEELLKQPNNILALEYLKVLQQDSIPITPLTIARQGTGYHSTDLSSFPSASAIRFSLLHNEKKESIANSMPARSMTLLKQEICSGRAPISLDSMEQSMLYKLRTLPLRQLENIYEISEGLENRIQKAAISCGSIDELTHNIKSKRYSLSRINRTLLYVLMDLYADTVQQYDQIGPQYLHILGFSSLGQKILQEIKTKSKIDILSRGHDVKDLHFNGDANASSMIDLDIKATNIYTLLYPNPSMRQGNLDFTQSPIMV
ncbi:MAG: nucleotidyltransferase [Bacillota bacterium]|nr:nucleotidyltransferase [Bacillota bacterium]